MIRAFAIPLLVIVTLGAALCAAGVAWERCIL
jgi:hypothetical protein